MRDERQEEDNLISGVQYIVFSSYGDYFLSVLGEVCKSLATWDNNNIDNTEEEWMLWAHNNDRVIISMLALHNLSSVGANISNRNCSVTSPCQADNQNTKKLRPQIPLYRSDPGESPLFYMESRGGVGNKTKTQILLASITLGCNRTNVSILFPGTL